jgi:hypothetical protein
MLRTLLLCLVLLPPAAAATVVYTVDSTVDAGDAFSGDDLCASAAGQCTLRAALEEIQGHYFSTEEFEIRVPTGTYELSYVTNDYPESLAAGDLDIAPAQLSPRLTVRGWDGGIPTPDRRPHIRPGPNFPRRLLRAFMHAGQTVALSDLQLVDADARAWGTFFPDNGGAIACTFGESGVAGTLELSRIRIAGTRTDGIGAALYSKGCSLRLDEVSIEGNCGAAAALYSTDSTALNPPLRTLRFANSSFTGNSADCLGNPNSQFHAIVLAGSIGAESWDAALINVTLGDNRGSLMVNAPGTGAIRNLLLRHVTFAANAPDYLGTDSLLLFGHIAAQVAHSTLGDLPGMIEPSASFVSLGHARYGFPAASQGVLPHATDLTLDVPSDLGPSRAISAYTFGYAPLAGSALVDGGADAADDADPAACATRDQTGTARPLNGACDVGALESTALFVDGFE